MGRRQGHSAIGRVRSIEKSGDFFGNGTSDLLDCRTVRQPTTLPRDPQIIFIMNKNFMNQPQAMPLFRCFVYYSRAFDSEFRITNETCFRK
jgi:hypothetical protein